MICYIYKSSRKDYTYLYLVKKDDFTVVPEGLLNVFGAPEFAFSFNFTGERKLAQEDPKVVLAGLEENGYFLQMEKTDTVKI